MGLCFYAVFLTFPHSPFLGGNFLDTTCDCCGFGAGKVRRGDGDGSGEKPEHPRDLVQGRGAAAPAEGCPEGCPSPGRGLLARTPCCPPRFGSVPPHPSPPPREGAAGLEGSSWLSPNEHGLRDLKALNLPFGGRLECVSPPNSHQKQRTSLISFRALLSSFPRLIPLNVKHPQTFPRGPRRGDQPPGRTGVPSACTGSSRRGDPSSEQEVPLLTSRPNSPDGQHPRRVGSGGCPGEGGRHLTGRKSTAAGTSP